MYQLTFFFNNFISSGVRVNDTLYLSGVIGIDAKTDKLVNGGIISETEQIFKNIEILLKANDSSFNKGRKIMISIR